MHQKEIHTMLIYGNDNRTHQYPNYDSYKVNISRVSHLH